MPSQYPIRHFRQLAAWVCGLATPTIAPVGVATQKPNLRQRLKIEKGAQQLDNFFRASTELMQVMARACGHDDLSKFCIDDLTTWNREMAHLTGIAYGGVSAE